MASASGGVSPTARARRSKKPWELWWRSMRLWWRLTKESDGVAQLILARRPEERLINDYELIQATVRKVTTTIAYLSLTWSTVVLLGGFVSVLKLIDFWFLTAISTAFAINVADLYEQKVAYIFAAGQAYIGLCDDLARRFSFWSCLVAVCSMLAEACLGVLMMAFSFVIQVLTFAPLVAIFLSLVRLVVPRYGNAGADAANAAKLKAALQIFYSLALAQNTLFYSWKTLIYTWPRRASDVRKQCGFGNWGTRLLRRYVKETRKMCSTQGHLPDGWNLITFAVGLLGSESSLDDRHDAVRLLDTFVGNKIPVASKLLPFKVPIENLMEALEMGDGEIRERAARVVAALAGNLCYVDQFPSALHHIASLLQQASDEKFPTTTSAGAGTSTKSMQEHEDEQTGRNLYSGLVYRGILSLLNIYIYRTFENKEETDIPNICGEPKQLISQGLLIIERLTLHQGNCVHICSSHTGLLSKITAPLNSSNAFLDDAVEEYNSEWIDILSGSLRILARLIRAPGEASRGLRNEIASNTQAVTNLTRILEGDKFGPVLKGPAIQILVELAFLDNVAPTSLGKGETHKFITRLWGIFLAAPQKDGIGTGDNNNNRTTIEDEETQQAQATRLRQEAGEALVQMLSVLDAGSSSDILQVLIPSGSEGHVVGQLTCMLITGNSKGCHQTQTWAAEILKCLCSHLTNEHRQIPRQHVIQMLTKVLQLIISIQREKSDGTTVVLAGADSNHATENDEENPRPAEEHAAGNQSSSSLSKDEKKFVVALLSLAVAICNSTMVNAHDFISAAPVDIVLLVTKLKEMIETNNDATVECLQVVKLSCQMVVSMVQLEPSSAKVFIDISFMDILSKSSKSLSDLDNCLMLFDANYHQVTKTDKPLASLVKQALQELFDKAQELGNNGPGA